MSLYYTTMPRNTKGGNRHKKQARKSAYSDVKKAKTRLAKEEGELYAKVIKLYGGGRASGSASVGLRWRADGSPAQRHPMMLGSSGNR